MISSVVFLLALLVLLVGGPLWVVAKIAVTCAQRRSRRFMNDVNALAGVYSMTMRDLRLAHRYVYCMGRRSRNLMRHAKYTLGLSGELVVISKQLHYVAEGGPFGYVALVLLLVMIVVLVVTIGAWWRGLPHHSERR